MRVVHMRSWWIGASLFGRDATVIMASAAGEGFSFSLITLALLLLALASFAPRSFIDGGGLLSKACLWVRSLPLSLNEQLPPKGTLGVQQGMQDV